MCPVSETGKSQLGQEWTGRHKATPRRGTEATVTPRMRERQGGVRDEEREHLKGSGIQPGSRGGPGQVAWRRREEVASSTEGPEGPAPGRSPDIRPKEGKGQAHLTGSPGPAG